MYQETIDTMTAMAEKKASFLRGNKLGYFLASALAGAYVGFGIILIFSIGASLATSPARGAVMGASFGIALALVIFAGAELFTGNNLVMTCGLWKGKTTVKDLLSVWGLSWIGNLAGSVGLAALLHFSQAPLTKGAAFVGTVAAAKMTGSFVSLFFKAVLCNWLVCLAVWSAARAKSESGKLIMISWCLFAFITSGYEHSVANMTLLTVAMFESAGTAGVTWSGWLHNVSIVTLGNVVGGSLAVAVPYLLASRDTKKTESKVQPIVAAAADREDIDNVGFRPSKAPRRAA